MAIDARVPIPCGWFATSGFPQKLAVKVTGPLVYSMRDNITPHLLAIWFEIGKLKNWCGVSGKNS